MSANSTSRLLAGTSPHVAAAAKGIKANVCWALMLALREPTGECWELGVCCEHQGNVICECPKLVSLGIVGHICSC